MSDPETANSVDEAEKAIEAATVLVRGIKCRGEVKVGSTLELLTERDGSHIITNSRSDSWGEVVKWIVDELTWQVEEGVDRDYKSLGVHTIIVLEDLPAQTCE